jgi:hypothetical protein
MATDPIKNDEKISDTIEIQREQYIVLAEALMKASNLSSTIYIKMCSLLAFLIITHPLEVSPMRDKAGDRFNASILFISLATLIYLLIAIM